MVSASPLLIAHTQASRRPAGPYSGNIASGDMLSDPGGGGGGELKNGSREETDGKYPLQAVFQFVPREQVN